MLKRGFIAILCLLMSHLVTAAEATILVMGDSLSAAYGVPTEQGWTQLLQQKLTAQAYAYQVVNASISGDTTHNGLSRLPAALAQHTPDILILELGGNDGLRGLSLSTMQSNLIEMIALAHEQNAQVLLLGIKIPPNYGPAYTQRFEQVFATVAEQTKVAFEPFFLAEITENPDLMQADGIHPNAAAQPLMLEHIWDDLEPLLQ
jgi:acyl-CoA thioesterase-1